MDKHAALETTRPGAKNRTYALIPAETVAPKYLKYSPEQDVALILTEHARGLRELTPDQVSSLTASTPEHVRQWADRLPSAS